MSYRKSASLFLAGSIVAFFTPAQAADDTNYLNATARIFMDTCMKTAPDFTGIDAALAAKGYQQQSDGTWSNSQINVVPRAKQSGEGTSCSVWRHGIDPKETAERVVLVMAKARYADIKASAKGRRTTITFTLQGKDMIVKVEPLMQKFTSISVSEATK